MPAHQKILYTTITVILGLPAPGAADDGSSSWQGSLYLRGSYSDPSVIQGRDAPPAALAASPFALSFQRDDVADIETYAMRGAIIADWRRTHDARGALKLSALSFGIDLDQSRQNGVRNADTLDFRFGGAWLFQNDGARSFWRSHYLSSSIGWTTDHDFELSVLSAKISYTPLGESYGFAGVPFGRGNFKYQLTPTFSAEYLNIIDANEREEFIDIDETLYVGASLKAVGSYFDGPLEPLTLNASYSYFVDALGNSEDKDLVEIGVSWSLVEGGNVSLNTSYTKGSTPTRKQSDRLTVGIGIAF